MTLEHLSYFLEIVHCGSISQAAQKLFLERSNLSAVISRLENHFGAKLLHRTSKGVTLTSQGQLVYDWAKRFLEEKEQLENLFSQRHIPNLSGKLFLYTSAIANSDFHAKPLEQFISLHPSVSLQMFSENIETSLQATANNTEAVSFLSLTQDDLSLLQTYPNLQFYKLLNIPLAAYVPAEHYFAKKYSTISLKTLSNAPLLLYMTNNESLVFNILKSYTTFTTTLSTVYDIDLFQKMLSTKNYISVGIGAPFSPPIFKNLTCIPIRDCPPLYHGIVVQKKAVLENSLIRCLLRLYYDLFKLPLPQELFER